MAFITKGKELIRFDTVGSREYPHILKCLHCEEEFRTTMNKKEICCPKCQHNKSYDQLNKSFEVIGLVENSYRELAVS